MRELTSVAFGYADMGLRVFALTDKMPNGSVCRNGLYDFLTSVDTTSKFEYQFEHPKTTGIGILTGPVWYVVDIDGEEGARQWRDMAGEDFMPTRWVAKTGRGLHLWVSSFEEWPTVKLGPKLDFKGIGGYVAAPPSRHPDGHLYEWLLPPDRDFPPMEMPDGLHEVLEAARWAKTRSKVKAVERKRENEALTADGIIVNTTSFEGILDRVKTAGPGERNNVLNWAAYTMISDGCSDDELQALAEVARAAGLPDREIVRTINSAMESLDDRSI